MNLVEFVVGRSGSGKSSYCYTKIQEALKEDSYTSLLMLVPEQFNLQTQRELSKKLYPGLLRAEVISFNTLAREVFNEVGHSKEAVIEDLERMIMLKKIIEEHRKEIVFYKKNLNNTGFIESLNRLITVFEQAGLQREHLEDMIDSEQSSPLFKSKLTDLRMIYHYFEEYMSGRFMTVEKNMSLLAKAIPKSRKLEDAWLWIDGFYGFTFNQLRILEELIQKVKGVTISLPMDKPYEEKESVRLNHPFYESIHTMQKLMGICSKLGVSYKINHLKVQREKVVPEIAHLEKQYLKPYQLPYEGVSEAISLKRYSCRMEEVEEAAKEIVTLVRESGYRYHDIAIIVGDLAEYKSLFESSFKEYGIPYFLDMKRNIHTNSLVAALEGVIELITSNYSYKSMMAFLRTYMLPIDKEDIDRLENYILAHGIKGKKKWQQAWNFEPEQPEREEKINLIRERILEPIKALEERLKASKENGVYKVIDLTKSLFYFLEDIGAYRTLEGIIAKNKEEQNRLLELENSQIWTKTIEVFERLVDILGEEKISISTYKRILETSFSYLKMGVIPPAQDQVLIGTTDRTRLPHLKAIFILGTNEGLIPKVEETTTLFSDMDKMAIGTLCDRQGGPKERLSDLVVHSPVYAHQFTVYTMLTRASQRLYVSSTLADENGKPMRPSIVYYRLSKMFGEKNAKKQEGILDHVHRPLPTLGYVGGLLREHIDGRLKHEEDWKDIVSWYAKNPVWRERLKGLKDALFYTNQQHYLEEETTSMLYGNVLDTSITRLENFRNCACCYFMRYGIRAEERRIFSWNQAKVGTLFHSALEQYPKELAAMGTTWITANQIEMNEAVKRATHFAVSHMKSMDIEGGKYKYTASKVEKMTKRAIRALTAHLKNGEFIPTGYEINFGEGQGFPPIEVNIDEVRKLRITGQIDRVDVYYKDEQTNYVKILDYKTGNKNFSLLEVYYGLQLQLLLYLDAYLKLNKAYEPGGVFYFHINNPYVNYKAGMGEEELEESGLKQFKLSGLALEQEDVIAALDKAGTGATIPVSLNKDGSIKKGSSVASEKQFKLLEDYVIDIVRELGKQILEGKVSAKPYKLGDKNSCTYCIYHTICQFNEEQRDNCYDSLEKISKEDIWCKIEEGKGGC